MESSAFFLTLAVGAGFGYLAGKVETWRLAKRLEKHGIKPSSWEEPLTDTVADTVQTLGRSVTS